MDETASACNYVAATHHYLESWGDYEFKTGYYFLAQPTIRPLFDTLQFQDFILSITDENENYYSFIKKYWTDNLLGGNSFSKALHDGYYKKAYSIKNNKSFRPNDMFAKASILVEKDKKGMSLILYPKTGMGDGQQANNPWLKEFPDPVTRVSWDNYITISKNDADVIGLKNVSVANGALNGSYANIKVENQS